MPPESAGNCAESAKHILFPGSLDLLRIQDVSRGAVGGVKSEDILTAKQGYRAVEHGGAVGPLTDLASYLCGQVLFWKPVHEAESIPNAPVRDEAEYGRLL